MTVLCDQCWKTVGDRWTVDLPDRDYLTPNDRTNWKGRARLIKPWREDARLMARARNVPPLRSGAVVQLHFWPGDRRRRDRVNLCLVHKAVVDGLVDAGVFPDDTPEHIDERMPVIHKGSGDRRWELHIYGTPLGD